MTNRMVAKGSLTRRSWRSAFEEVPRHLFTPQFLVMERDRGWQAVDECDSVFLPLVYESQSLITQLDGDPTSWHCARRDGYYLGGWPSSSSSDPELMARMLELLDISAGQTILEIGTGTGYNAALLCHALGDSQVTSVDVDSVVVAEARRRLEILGYQPRLVVTDAMVAVPPGPYDRLEVTVAVPRVPAAWLAQTPPGAMILVTFASGLIADTLFRLRVWDDGTVRGNATPESASFMPTRDAHPPQAYELFPNIKMADSVTEATDVEFSVVNDYDSGFPSMLSLAMRDVQRYLTDSEHWNWLIATDGSWVHAVKPSVVTSGGPRRLWQRVEQLWRLWNDYERPQRSQLGLTITPTGRHTVWARSPDNSLFNLN